MRARPWLLLGASSLALLACDRPAKPEGAPPAALDAAAAVPAPTADPVTFSKKAPVVGAKRRETGDMAMALSVRIDPGGGKAAASELKTTESTRQTRELLAVSGDAPTKVKVRFDAAEATTAEDGHESRKASPLAGKTYVATVKSGAVVVTDERGKAVPATEDEEVSKRFASLGKPDPITAALPTTPQRPGEKVDALSRSVAEYIAEGQGGVSVSDVSVTFREKAGDDGVFAVSVKLAKDEGPAAMTAALTGELRVSTSTGEPRKMELRGPVSIRGSASTNAAKGKPKIEGEGTISISMRIEPL